MLLESHMKTMGCKWLAKNNPMHSRGRGLARGAWRARARRRRADASHRSDDIISCPAPSDPSLDRAARSAPPWRSRRSRGRGRVRRRPARARQRRAAAAPRHRSGPPRPTRALPAPSLDSAPRPAPLAASPPARGPWAGARRAARARRPRQSKPPGWPGGLRLRRRLRIQSFTYQYSNQRYWRKRGSLK
jgi:hypothetical protein